MRDLDAVAAGGVRSGVDALGGEIDIVVANAGGVVAIGRKDPLDTEVYRDIVETNLNGVWHTIVATVPSIIRKGRGGSIILTSSAQGLVGKGGDGSAAMFAYAAAKHGVVGLMRSAANAYAQNNIRVNTVHPSGVGTPDDPQRPHAQDVPGEPPTAPRCRPTCCRSRSLMPRTSPMRSSSWPDPKPATSPASRYRSMPVTR